MLERGQVIQAPRSPGLHALYLMRELVYGQSRHTTTHVKPQRTSKTYTGSQYTEDRVYVKL